MTKEEVEKAKELCEALKSALDIASHIAYLRDYARFLPKALAYIEELEAKVKALEYLSDSWDESTRAKIKGLEAKLGVVREDLEEIKGNFNMKCGQCGLNFICSSKALSKIGKVEVK